MTQFRIGVHVVPRRGILDPQGQAIAEALHSLDFSAVRHVRVGRHVLIDVDAADERAARATVGDMCQRLLANPVTEDFELATVEAL